MSYSLDPNRATPFTVIDMFDEVGMAGVYAGSYEDCENFIASQADSWCVGMYQIIPNIAGIRKDVNEKQ